MLLLFAVLLSSWASSDDVETEHRNSHRYQMLMNDEYAGVETQAVFPAGDDETRSDVADGDGGGGPNRSEAAYVDRVKEGSATKLYYRIGPLRVPVPGNVFRNDRYNLKEAILKIDRASFPKFYPKYEKFIAEMRSAVNDAHFNRDLRRETVDSIVSNEMALDYKKERFHYFIQGMERRAKLVGHTPTTYGEPPKQVASCAPNNRSGYAFSLIPFKTGDLDAKCKEMVDRGVASGHDKVTLHFPIHYSGGHSGGRVTIAGNRPMRYGWDYQYEDGAGIGKEELHRCLDYVMKAGLKLNFIPHAESIVTMSANGEAEWRIRSDLPLDDKYYDKAYGPLLEYMNKNKAALRGRTINVSAAAELDPSFLGDPHTSLGTVGKLKTALAGMGTKSEVIWSPNGDFFENNGWFKYPTSRMDCSKVVPLLSSIDRISPSIYENYGHVVDGSFHKTRELFLKRLFERLDKHCPKQMGAIKKEVTRKRFGITEFALDNSGEYEKFHREMKEHGRKTGDPEISAAFWNSGQWDHSGLADASRARPVFKKSIDTTLAACPAGRNPAAIVPTAPHCPAPDPSTSPDMRRLEDHAEGATAIIRNLPD
ncbi:MAG TPA: hypothetical protein DCY86_03080 [Bdellovibrionales bacterium]|nr:hypothetical protein [Bdellovibrionales bacterium]